MPMLGEHMSVPLLDEVVAFWCFRNAVGASKTLRAVIVDDFFDIAAASLPSGCLRSVAEMQAVEDGFISIMQCGNESV